MSSPDEPLGPDSFPGDDSESHYAAPAAWAEVRRDLAQRPDPRPAVRVHDLKLALGFFDDIVACRKTFELRLNDRDYRVGDELHLREWDGSSYTGRECFVDVAYVTDAPKLGALQPGFVCMSIRLLLRGDLLQPR